MYTQIKLVELPVPTRLMGICERCLDSLSGYFIIITVIVGLAMPLLTIYEPLRVRLRRYMRMMHKTSNFLRTRVLHDTVTYSQR